MRILLSGGGTAGHINPALAIADYICEKEKDTEVLFVGTKKGLESTLVVEHGYKIEFIQVQGLSKKLTLKNIKSLYHMITAKSVCKKIIRKFKPDVVIGLGGYVCAPVVMAANSLGIPTLIHEQNAFAGSAVKHLAKNSTVTMISFEESRKYMPDAKKIVFTGNPIRPAVLSCTREKAREALNLGDEKLIVIFGGSLGAAKINSVALAYMKTLINEKSVKVIFATGQRNYDEVKAEADKLGISGADNIDIRAYIHNMDEVMNAADVVVCRSGAITVSEICALGKNAILIPSPNVANNHQEYNARALSDNGAAITILEKDFDEKILKENIDKIICDEKVSESMSTAAKKISSVNALDLIYKEVKSVLR